MNLQLIPVTLEKQLTQVQELYRAVCRISWNRSHCRQFFDVVRLFWHSELIGSLCWYWIWQAELLSRDNEWTEVIKIGERNEVVFGNRSRERVSLFANDRWFLSKEYGSHYRRFHAPPCVTLPEQSFGKPVSLSRWMILDLGTSAGIVQMLLFLMAIKSSSLDTGIYPIFWSLNLRIWVRF